jgi:hypothetical protein
MARTLDAIGTALRERLPVASNFNSVNTRIILQTGINLKKIKPEQNSDEQAIGKVLSALLRMGVPIGGAV